VLERGASLASVPLTLSDEDPSQVVRPAVAAPSTRHHGRAATPDLGTPSVSLQKSKRVKLVKREIVMTEPARMRGLQRGDTPNGLAGRKKPRAEAQ